MVKGVFIFNKKRYALHDLVRTSAIYECSRCDNVAAFKKGETFTPCETCVERNDEQQWIRTNEVVHFVSKNLNVEYKKIETWGLKLADFIADHSGRISFVVIHVIWFTYWIYVNTGHALFGTGGFDPYPFGLLTMIVSLEAIFLATFILISQNRQGAKSELRADLDYQVNLKTEKEVAELTSMLRDIKEEGEKIENDTRALVKELITKIDKKDKRRNGNKKKKGSGKKAKRASKTILAEAGIDQISDE
jgi:uncharacterized membrane protein